LALEALRYLANKISALKEEKEDDQMIIKKMKQVIDILSQLANNSCSDGTH
jgi:prefoldin subunit 5